jgi:hypothetical protein
LDQLERLANGEPGLLYRQKGQAEDAAMAVWQIEENEIVRLEFIRIYRSAEAKT